LNIISYKSNDSSSLKLVTVLINSMILPPVNISIFFDITTVYKLLNEIATLKSKKVDLMIRYVFAFFVKRDYFSLDRKSTRLNSSHVSISYAVFCLKKKIYIKI